MTDQTARDVVAAAVRGGVCCKDSDDAAYWYFDDQTLQGIADAVLQALAAARGCGSPTTRTDAARVWRVLHGNEPEDVYVRGDDVTLSGVDTFLAVELPDIAAAFLAAAAAVSSLQEKP